jgi:hypothetical protein
MEGLNLNYLREMMSSRVGNYILPGMSSSLVAEDGKGANGRVRVFEATREQRDQITPHSHRFSFQCLVLRGTVWNILWKEDPSGDEYQLSSLYYEDMGKYKKTPVRVGRFKEEETYYGTGQWYSMAAHEIHSIEFSKDAIVLFFEGVSYMRTTEILEPWVDGELVPTFRVEPWMFKKTERKD